MIAKMLVEENEYEAIWKSFSMEKKLKHFTLCNAIEKDEEGDFIVAVDLNPEGYGDSHIIKMHYENNIMVVDSTEVF